jgi:hypothetical protein
LVSQCQKYAQTVSTNYERAGLDYQYSALVLTSPETQWHESWEKYDEVERVSVDLNDQQALTLVMKKFLVNQNIKFIQASLPDINCFSKRYPSINWNRRAFRESILVFSFQKKPTRVSRF